MTLINLPSAAAMLASAEQHFEESENAASADGRIRSTERASVMATMAVAKAIIELRDALSHDDEKSDGTLDRYGQDRSPVTAEEKAVVDAYLLGLEKGETGTVERP